MLKTRYEYPYTLAFGIHASDGLDHRVFFSFGSVVLMSLRHFIIRDRVVVNLY